MAKNEDKNVTNPSEIIADIINEVQSLDIKVETKQDKKITKELFWLFINELAKDYKITTALTVAGVFCTLQAGGTNNSKRSNVKITLGDVAFESRKVNSFIIKYCKGITPRQLARIFANEIMEVSTTYNITGNAYIYITRFHSELLNVNESDPNERFWCADFQSDNINCPEYIRFALKTRYNEKFRKSQINNKKT
jgi:hypothetical protein